MISYIPIRYQRILSFVPILNVFELFVWMYNVSRLNLKASEFLKSFFILLIRGVPLGIFYILIGHFFGTESLLYNIVFPVCVYAIPLSIGDGLIRYQKKLGVE